MRCLALGMDLVDCVVAADQLLAEAQALARMLSAEVSPPRCVS